MKFGGGGLSDGGEVVVGFVVDGDGCGCGVFGFEVEVMIGLVGDELFYVGDDGVDVFNIFFCWVGVVYVEVVLVVVFVGDVEVEVD